MTRIEELKLAIEGKTPLEIGELAIAMGFKAVEYGKEWKGVTWDGDQTFHCFPSEEVAAAWTMIHFISFWC